MVLAAAVIWMKTWWSGAVALCGVLFLHGSWWPTVRGHGDKGVGAGIGETGSVTVMSPSRPGPGRCLPVTPRGTLPSALFTSRSASSWGPGQSLIPINKTRGAEGAHSLQIYPSVSTGFEDKHC